MSEMDYTKTTFKGFDETVDSVVKISESKNFRITHIHDIEKSLNDRGFQLHPLKIVEI